MYVHTRRESNQHVADQESSGFAARRTAPDKPFGILACPRHGRFADVPLDRLQSTVFCRHEPSLRSEEDHTRRHAGAGFRMVPKKTESAMSRCSVACLVSLLGACASPPRYIVTSTPLKVSDPAHPGLCVAIDPKDPTGIWWWDAGRSGCADRSSSVIAADRASVARTTAGTVDASFQVGLVSGRSLQLRLEAFDGRIRDAISGLSVPAERRATLELPERPAIGNR
jgi:hypothetical protein